MAHVTQNGRCLLVRVAGDRRADEELLDAASSKSRLTAVSVPPRLMPMTASAGFHVRRVGFGKGTDEELAALHAVEAPVAAERGSNRMPQPAESYIAFAHNLPSQFNDHACLVETSYGTPVASGFCWSNSVGDQRVMECDLFVRRDHRRRGIGSRLLATICNETVDEGRSLLTWSTFGTVPAGDAFSRRAGGRIGRVNRTSELVLADVDWTMIKSWARASPHHADRSAAGSRCRRCDRRCPVRRRA